MANKLIVYTNNNSWRGYVIATSGGKSDSSSGNAGHQIYNRTGTDNGTALTSRANLAFGEGLIASDHSDTGSSVVKLNVVAGNGITITNNKQTIIAAKLATDSARGTVIAGTYNGTNGSSTVSRYKDGHIDVDIDCGTWS